ncbi:hypothetical protein EGW08_023206 [Elysia chlorotica]|uniref:Uncharacterized protein n=1 Tax=Elysia chlorotica TaxID=188477 RepID=A0A3S1BJZ6_ELYCH|nr:hypothetical protein EGW08_023206 [Elysia chlorotica]
MMMNNPRMTFDRLKEFGSTHLDESRARNLYYRLFISLCAKACRASGTIRLFPYAEVMKGHLSRWLNPDMTDARALIDDLLTVKICPWCYKPVNITVKKKLASGAAHKASLFTSEYTNEFLYCIEKNNRGIVEFPVVAADPARDRFHLNRIEWNVNKSSKFIIRAHVDEDMSGTGSCAGWPPTGAPRSRTSTRTCRGRDPVRDGRRRVSHQPLKFGRCHRTESRDYVESCCGYRDERFFVTVGERHVQGLIHVVQHSEFVQRIADGLVRIIWPKHNGSYQGYSRPPPSIDANESP